ncbi:MAG: glycerophosphodiester phosphodiesterase [Propionibacteriales bacterium]|nr:glycerophosphodiester phosphodiesterase [Propionibacteriales bacterium]
MQESPYPRPWVIAHRGASDTHAEHTLAAYEQAVKDGADGLECDVRLTRDGHLVCVHDRRVERTSDGRGVISTKRLDELNRFDWSSWKNPWADLDDEAELPDTEGRVVLTLHSLLGMVQDHDQPLTVSIETKHPTRYSGLVERMLVELLDHFGLARPSSGVSSARVMSFSLLSMRRLTRMAPAVPLVWLMDGKLPARVGDGRLPAGVGTAGPSCELVRENPDWVRRVDKRGHGVHVWTVNTAEDAKMCQSLPVEAVITDRPQMMRQWLTRD